MSDQNQNQSGHDALTGAKGRRDAAEAAKKGETTATSTGIVPERK